MVWKDCAKVNYRLQIWRYYLDGFVLGLNLTESRSHKHTRAYLNRSNQWGPGDPTGRFDTSEYGGVFRTRLGIKNIYGRIIIL